MKTPPSILFLNRVYPPADGATGKLLAELAPALVQRGHRVTVVTAESGAGGKPGEHVNGVQVERVHGLPFTRASHWRRALSYLSLYPALLWCALRLPRADVVVTLTDPPLLLLLGVLIKTVKGSRHIHWAQDLYPELAEEMKVLPQGGVVARTLRWLSTGGLRHADRVIAVGRCMKARIIARGVKPTAVQIIPNWGHSAEATGGSRVANPFRVEHELGGRFVVMYSGNLGLAHPFEAILDAAERLRESHPTALFLFVGSGPRLHWVREQVLKRSLHNVRFLPFQPKEKLAHSLAAADIHLASMQHELCGLVVPSKVYGVMAAGRPCVFLGPEESEAAQFILQHGCGSVLTKATGARLASCLAQWMGDESLLRETRDRVEAVAERVSLGAAVRAFSHSIQEIGGSSSIPARLKASEPHSPITSTMTTSS
ncbi:MAG: glycosyltransferase family 4 protein [Verrucomicrobia bacterium]|nr:glycosyltransferase family 4 protein [Verrucomicrobiota bacterium]